MKHNHVPVEVEGSERCYGGQTLFGELYEKEAH